MTETYEEAELRKWKELPDLEPRTEILEDLRRETFEPGPSAFPATETDR